MKGTANFYALSCSVWTEQTSLKSFILSVQIDEGLF